VVERFQSINLNGAYGDVAGNIAMKAVGHIPRRADGDDGFLPRSGDGCQNWKGYWPANKLPETLNPKNGWVASANNRMGSGVFITFEGNFDIAFRALRINCEIQRKIARSEKFDPEFSRKLQSDFKSYAYDYFRPVLKKLSPNSARSLILHQKILSWNGVTGPESRDATLFKAWRDCLAHVTDSVLGTTWDNADFLYDVFSNGNGNFWCGNRKSCLQFASTCWNSVVESFPDSVPRWGELQVAFFEHLGPSPDDTDWSREVFSGGDQYSVNDRDSDTDSFVSDGGPELRLVANMGEKKLSFLAPIGLSGNPNSKYYDNQLQDFVDNKYTTI